MNKFIKGVLVFSIPFIICLIMSSISYIVLDPFRVVYSYKDHYEDAFIDLNRDYVSTERLLNNNTQQHYNSFIFGSSRTLAFRPSLWKTYMPDSARVFSFDASGESIYGIYTKLKYLDEQNIPIDNALIILCRDNSFRHADYTGHLFKKHPLISGGSKVSFHIMFYRTFLTPKFLVSYFDYLINKEYKLYMKNYISEGYDILTNPVTNERYWVGLERQIDADPEFYYSIPEKNFYTRTTEEQIDAVQRIKEEHLQLLTGIKEILDKNNTSYKVVLSPLYEQMKLNPKDLEILKELFCNHLHDFSGKNEYTNDKTNYYEDSHYRPFIGDSIMKQIYAGNVELLENVR